MQAPFAKQESRPDKPFWYFLGEYSLSESMPYHENGDELAPGLLCQTMRELGMPPEFVEYIESTLIWFARKSPAHFRRERSGQPGRIRVFCQKKMIGDASSENTSNLYNFEQALEHERGTRHSGLKMKGGWGFFFVERGENIQEGVSTCSVLLIDLYLYKEGE
jgi:hypothetical protein